LNKLKKLSIKKIEELISEENRVFEAFGVGGTRVRLYNLMAEAGKIVLTSTMFPTLKTITLIFDDPVSTLKAAIEGIDDEYWNPDKARYNKAQFESIGRSLIQQLYVKDVAPEGLTTEQENEIAFYEKNNIRYVIEYHTDGKPYIINMGADGIR
jgi:hypothetical protein